MISPNYRLQFITHHNSRYSYIDSARLALEGGCRWIQLRMKNADKSLMEDTAVIIQQMCKNYEATFIINDNVLLAQKIEADGVHLGKDDMPIAQARKILGDRYIIGATINSFDDVLTHLRSDTPDYFGCGPFRFTSTKQNIAATLGINGYRNIMRQMRSSGINIPIVAIGGICNDDITDILDCGINGIAISGSVLNADNPTAEMANISTTISQFQNKKK